jgi:hypothetical protein
MRFGRLSLTRLGVYPGSLGNYGGLFKQIPVVTIELPNGTVMPAQKEQVVMWQDMLRWMKNNINTLAGRPLQVKNDDEKTALSTISSKLRLEPCSEVSIAFNCHRSYPFEFKLDCSLEPNQSSFLCRGGELSEEPIKMGGEQRNILVSTPTLASPLPLPLQGGGDVLSN